MKFIYLTTLILLLSTLGVVKAQDVSFSFANSVVTFDGTDSIFNVDVMIATNTPGGNFTMSSGQLYFNYSQDAFGLNVDGADRLGLFYDDPDYLLSIKDNQFGIIPVYTPPIMNDNTPTRFSIAWQQDRAGSCIGEQITEIPKKLFQIQLTYLPNGTGSISGLCFEDSPVYTDQIYTACGPFNSCASLPAADCTNNPGSQITADFFSCTTVNACAIAGISSNSAQVASSCTSGSTPWIVLSNQLGQAIMSIDPRGNNLGQVAGNVFVGNAPVIYNDLAYSGRRYKVTPEFQPVTPVDVRVFLSGQELSDLQNEAKDTPPLSDNFISIAELGIVKYQGPTEDNTIDFTDATSLDFINQNTNGVKFGANYIEFTVSSFSEFWITSENTFLPLELVSFEAEAFRNDVSLDWTTENEENTSKFIIQRSPDGVQFSPIGTVAAAGTSNATLNYNFLDDEPLQGRSYYRLKMIDIDGTFSHSKTVSVLRDEFQIVNIYPNPVQDEDITVTLINPFVGEVNIEIIDFMGRVVISQIEDMSVGNGIVKIPSKSLAPGAYMLQVRNLHYKTVKKFVKVEY